MFAIAFGANGRPLLAAIPASVSEADAALRGCNRRTKSLGPRDSCLLLGNRYECLRILGF